MKATIRGQLLVAGVSVFLLSSCVSSKKYHRSQDALQQARQDSAQLAQRAASLDSSLQVSRQNNMMLRQSLDSTTTNYNTAQNSLNYYQSYFEKQQTALSQVSQQAKDTLVQAGLTGDEVQQDNGRLYINLKESAIFRNNSTIVTSQGKQVLMGIAAVLKDKDNLAVSVDNGGTGAYSTDMTSAMPANDNMPATTHRKRVHAWKSHTTTSTATTGAGGTGMGTTNSGNAPDKTAVAMHRPRPRARKYSTEGGYTYTNGGNFPGKRSSTWMLKYGRVNTVANTMLKNGVSQVSIVVQRPNNGMDQKNIIRVVVSPTMNNFTVPGGTTANKPVASGTN